MKNIPFAIFFWGLLFPLVSQAQTSMHDSLMEITTRLPGHAKSSTLTVSVKNGIAIMQDDIVLGPLEKLQETAQDRGLVLQDLDDRWPNGKIAFEIDGDFSPAYRDIILTAIDYINGSTNLLLYPRGSNDTYWISYEPSDVCESKIGLQDFFGQTISLQDYTINNGNGCKFPQIIHETAHAAGLWHEQCRADRDQFVDINWQNIQSDKKHNFEKSIDDNQEIGGYDFNSRMHYLPYAFAINPNIPTITRKPGMGTPTDLGNTIDYSQGDVNAINWLYATKNCALFFNLNKQIPFVKRPLFYEAALTITSNAPITSGNTVTFDATTSITLQPGFIAPEGSTFRAVMDGCNGLVHPLEDNPPDEYSGSGSYEAHLEGLLREALADKTQQVNTSFDIAVSPNPFSNSTTVRYTLPAELPVGIQLLDATGKLISTPVPTETQSEGEHQVVLEAGNLPAGMYFLVLQLGEKRETRRLVLNK
jgi:astacin